MFSLRPQGDDVGYGGALRVNRRGPATVINLSANGRPPVELCHRWSTVTATGPGGAPRDMGALGVCSG